MSNFLGWFFHVLGVKKIFKDILKNTLATALKSYIKWLLFFFFLKKVEKVEKNSFFRASTQILKSECTTQSKEL